MAEAAAEEGVGEGALGGGHFFEGQAFARFGNEMPIETFVVGEGVGGFGFLGGVQGDEEVARRMEDLKAGKAVTVPWEQLHRELLAMVNER